MLQNHKGIGNIPKFFVLFATFLRGQGTTGQYKVAKYTKNLATLLWPEEHSCSQVQPSRLNLLVKLLMSLNRRKKIVIFACVLMIGIDFVSSIGYMKDTEGYGGIM